MKKLIIIFVLFLIGILSPQIVSARDFGMGVHILHPDEIGLVIPHRGNADKFYLTVPFLLSDDRHEVWESFFRESTKHRITPILRLSADFDKELNAWRVPKKSEIVAAVKFFSSIQEWRGDRIVVLFNEPNHAKEWGARLDPHSYADTAMFAASWLHTEKQPYIVLPAGLDGAAPTSPHTMDSLLFWRKVFARQPDLVNWINGWTSHSYPNPGFVGSAYGVGKRSIRGFESELAFLRTYSKQDLPVYITETGWRQTRRISPLLTSYYAHAYKEVWSHPQVRAVTVFLFQGSPGPFEEFSLFTPSGTPTPQFDALEKLLTYPLTP